MFFWRKLSFLYKPLLPLFFPCIWGMIILSKLFYRKDRKKVLLVAQNNVAVIHIHPISMLLCNNKREVQQFITTDWFPARETTKDDLNTHCSKYINIIFALVLYWDLIIFVNHPWGFGIWFAPFIKKIYINHGLHTGKINNRQGEDGVYGPCRVNRPFKRPYYQCMLVSSEHEKKQAIFENPFLKDRLYVAGFLKADNLVKQNYQREAIRHKLNLSPHTVVIHIISTWGSHSLMQTIGEELLDEAVRLADKTNCQFIFSLHPRHDEFGDIQSRFRNDILDNFEKKGLTVNRGLDWEEYVIAADCAISDHSSLSLYYFLLNKPVSYIKVQSTEYLEDYLFNFLNQNFPCLNQANELVAIVHQLMTNDFKVPINKVKKMILSHQGKSAERYLQKIEQLLN